MKSAVTFAVAFFLMTHSKLSAQISISPAQAGNHIGDSVKICDKILEGKYLYQAKDEATQLYMGSKQPNPQLTIVISKTLVGLMKYDPEKKLVNKQVCVLGRISSIDGKPAIVLQKPTDIDDMEEK